MGTFKLTVCQDPTLQIGIPLGKTCFIARFIRGKSARDYKAVWFYEWR